MKYFDKFPKIFYNIDNDRVLFTNIMKRLAIINSIKKNAYVYYDYTIPEAIGSIEKLAERYYGDPEYHWIIAYANDYSDPLLDWPRNYRDFNNYIDEKYGSKAAAVALPGRYNKIITREIDGIQDIQTFQITEEEYNELPVTSTEAINFETYTVTEVITTEVINSYDLEVLLNEAKRQIKLIKKDYIPQIVNEFNETMGSRLKPGMRSFAT